MNPTGTRPNLNIGRYQPVGTRFYPLFTGVDPGILLEPSPSPVALCRIDLDQSQPPKILINNLISASSRRDTGSRWPVFIPRML
jgi:hypothetical protein